MMRGLVFLGLAGAGAYWAAKRGYLPAAAPIADALDPFLGRVAAILPQDQWDAPAVQRAAWVQGVRAATGGAVAPILGRDEVATLNKYEAMLRRNWRDVSPWARRNVGWAAAIARVENAAMDPRAAGDGGQSIGIYQVKIATAETCYRAGYTTYNPDRDTLATESGGVYFGTAEMDRLSGINADTDWIIQAYNGGAGFAQMGDKYRHDRDNYLRRVKAAYVELYATGEYTA